MNKRGDSNKACSWDFFLKKNKKNSMLIRDFRVLIQLQNFFHVDNSNNNLRIEMHPIGSNNKVHP